MLGLLICGLSAVSLTGAVECGALSACCSVWCVRVDCFPHNVCDCKMELLWVSHPHLPFLLLSAILLLEFPAVNQGEDVIDIFFSAMILSR